MVREDNKNRHKPKTKNIEIAWIRHNEKKQTETANVERTLHRQKKRERERKRVRERKRDGERERERETKKKQIEPPNDETYSRVTFTTKKP